MKNRSLTKDYSRVSQGAVSDWGWENANAQTWEA